MANSRLEKIGNIFSRTTGLLKSGAMKVEDKPIWYDIFAAFPPKLEPKFDRPEPNMEIKPLFYQEDVIRAKFHKNNKNTGLINLQDTNFKTKTQTFIEIYNKLQAQGALSDEKVFETAKDLLQQELEEQYNKNKEAGQALGLLSSFSEANQAQGQGKGSSVKLDDIFK